MAKFALVFFLLGLVVSSAACSFELMDESTGTFSDRPEDDPIMNRPGREYVAAQPNPYGAAQVQPRPQAQTVRFGNVVDMPGTVGGVAFPQNFTPQLLEANLAAIDETELYKQGSWVLTMQSTVNYPDNPTANTLAPLIAEVLIGSGGASVVFEVSVVPSCVIAVPSGSVRVNLKWDAMPINVSPASPYLPPTSVRVSGFIQRSTTETNARRSFLTQLDGSSGVTIQGAIPQFASAAMVYGERTDTIYGATSYLQLSEGPNGLSQVFGTELEALLIAGSAVQVPSGATIWTLFKQDPSIVPSRVDFILDL